MKIKQTIIAVVCALCALSANAGYIQPVAVEIDFVNRISSGDMLTARLSDNDQMLIGCGSRTIQVGSGDILQYGFCQSRIAEGEEGGIICTTFDEQLVAAMDSISDYSYVTFSWNEDNECTRIGNSTQSFYLPSQKIKK